MAETINLGTYTIILGAEEVIDVTISDRDGASLASAEATMTLYNNSGTVVSGPTACTMTGTTSRNAAYLLTTGEGKTLTAAGRYRGVIQATAGSEKPKFQVTIIVMPAPF